MTEQKLTLVDEWRSEVMVNRNANRILDDFEAGQIRHECWKRSVGKLRDVPFVVKETGNNGREV